MSAQEGKCAGEGEDGARKGAAAAHGKPERRTTRPLGFIVAGEAQRILSDEQIAADPERLAAGWTRRFVADGVRAREMIALYEELGFEVAADPIQPEHMGDSCGDCRLLILQQFQMIYTREKQPTTERR